MIVILFAEQFFPDMIIEAETSYFVRACQDLTEDEQMDVKNHFIGVLNEHKVRKISSFIVLPLRPHSNK